MPVNITQQQWDDFKREAGPDKAFAWAQENEVIVDGVPVSPKLAVSSQAELPPLQGQRMSPLQQASVPADQTQYDENAANIANIRRMMSDPIGYMLSQRQQEMAELDKRYPAYTDPESEAYRRRGAAVGLNIAAQLMKPSYTFGQNISDVLGYLGTTATSRDETLAALEQKRAELRQKYDIEMFKAAMDLEERRIAAAQKSPWTGAAYDPSKGWVPRPESGLPQPVVLRGKTKDGRDTEKYADGSFRVYNKDGSSQLYDAKGDPING